MIIDAHCHAGPGDGFNGPWDTAAPLARYLERCDDAGITHSVLFSALHTDYLAANRNVARIVAHDRARFTGLAFVHAERDRGHVMAIVGEAVRQHRFRGIKAHRHDARVMREVCEAARAFGIPLLYDVVGEVSQVRLLAEQYPDVAFVIPHLSSFADDWAAQAAFVDVLVRYPNVFTDTSGVRRFDVLEEAVARAGAHKVLFGTDGPWLHPGVELAKVRALRLSPNDEALVLGGNARRLYGAGATSRGGTSAARVRRPAWRPFASAAPGR